MKSSDSGAGSGSMKGGKAHARAARGGHMAGGNAEQVRAVQQALKDKGHDPGDVDGKMGPKTQAALRDFQSKEGLKATGRLDSETMAKLGVEGKTSAAGGSSTSTSASPKSSDTSSSGSASPSSTSGSSSSTPSSSSAPSTSGSSTTGSSSTDNSSKK
ncbi:MAG TPA: peptidoglycan-binding domain-containing protein [Methylomirabilota bacterium]|nr:peptidoglycan-binding domain-containing protein [Methylomirabilota bacterium]